MNLEICCCSGGMAEGLRRAGIAIDVAIDKDSDACDSYERNLGHRPVQMDARDLLRMARAGWRPGHVDLLVADPPCTPWSRAGRRQGVEDERDLLHCVTELIALLRPDAYLIGNVPGLQDSTQWHHVQAALAPLRRAGYCIADFAELDAADYGVPQRRIRPFWFGHLAGPCVRWPAPTHCSPEESKQARVDGPAVQPWVTCREALQHLPLEELGRPVRMRVRHQNGAEHGSVLEKPAKVVGTSNLCDGNVLLNPPRERHPVSEAGAPARTLRADGGREWRHESVLLINDRHPPASPASPAPTLGAKSRQQGAQLLRLEDPNRPPAPGDEPHRTVTGVRDQALLAWPWDRPATKVAAGDDRLPSPGHHAAGSGHSTQHGPDAIVLSERAASLLQGFPDGWGFSGATKKSRWSQLGQAMPPALAEAVGRSIKAQMEAAHESERLQRLIDEECA